MRYNLESTLPIDAFKPRGGRSPFAHGMTLEGGGGGFIGKALGSVAKGVTDVVKGVVQPVYNATLKNIPGVDNALVNLDKSVGKAIPGGWGTVASVAASFIPGAQLAAMGMTQTGLATGLGALTGSGVMRGNHQFNLQGAIMGGAMAYGASQLSQAFQEAGKAATSASTTGTTDAIANAADKTIAPGSGYVPEGGMGTGSTISSVPPSAPTPPAGSGYDYSSGLSQMSGNAAQPYTPPPSFLEKAGTSLSNIPSNIESGIKSLGENALKPFDPATYQGLGTKLADTASGTMSNMGDFGSGVAKVLGGSASLPAGTVMSAGIPMVLGASGLAALEEQQKYLDQQLAAGNIAQDQYNAEKASIDEQIRVAREAVAANPLKSTVDQSNISQDPTLYAGRSGGDTLYDKSPGGGTSLLYAMGGSVNPPDDQTGIPTQSPMRNFDGGIMGLARGGHVQHYFLGGMFDGGGGMFGGGIPIGAIQAVVAKAEAEQAKEAAAKVVKDNPLHTSADISGITSLTNVPSNATLYVQNKSGDDFYDLNRNSKRSTYAAGGQFLSGGGDGMSDSIPANIGGKQEARLADGEFVIPADVVSHLGNGSSKAGAKQLYSMMDKVRKARTGRKSQGKQINPRKYMPV